jgi:glycosyltransferase involved in cell wall biosynthesis
MLSPQVPLVSIIIPAFNERDWICDAIDSALAQTHPACEIVVVDDGSTDGTADVVRARYGPTVGCIRQPNSGLPAARNAGLRSAKGEYVQFLDADDLLLPTKVALHVAVLEQDPGCGVVYSDFAFTAGAGEDPVAPSGYGDRHRSGLMLNDLIADNFIVVHSALSRTDIVRDAGGFDERLGACEDYDLWLRLAAAGCVFRHTADALVVYRRRPMSMSSAPARQVAATIEVVARVPEYAALDDEGRRVLRRRLSLLREMLARVLVLDALSFVRSGRVDRAARSLVRAFRADPAAVPRTFMRVVCGAGWRARSSSQERPR